MKGTRGGDLLVTRRMRHHDQICQPRLVGNNNVRFPPDDRGKAGRGFVGVWSRLGHSQTVLGCQPLEQVAHGAFPISVYSRVQHGQVRAPQSRDHDRRRECGRRGGGELQGQQNFSDRHQFRSNSNTGSVQIAVPRAITRSHRMENHRWSDPQQATSASSDVLEQISPLRSNISETALRISLGIRTRPAYQLGDGLIVKIESVSDACAQRVEFPSTPFDDGKVLTVGYEQIMLLLGDDFQHRCPPSARRIGAILVLVLSCPRKFDLGVRQTYTRRRSPTVAGRACRRTSVLRH